MERREGCCGGDGPRERGTDQGISLRETERPSQLEGWEAVLRKGMFGSDRMDSVAVAVGDGCGREVRVSL